MGCSSSLRESIGMGDYVVIDIETSGVNSSTSQIIGISAVLLKDGIVDGLKYECWCRCHDLEKAAADIIGKKTAFFEEQLPLKRAIHNLKSFINGKTLIAKSPSFCKDFLYKAGLSAEHDITDALDLVRAYLKGFSPYDYEDFGWSSGKIGEGYGEGYSLNALHNSIGDISHFD